MMFGGLGPPTPSTPATGAASSAAGGLVAPRLDPNQPLDTALTVLTSLRGLINHLYAPLATTATASTAAADGKDEKSAGSGVMGSDLSVWHAMAPTLQQHSWERSMTEFDDRLLSLQRHIAVAEEKYTIATTAGVSSSSNSLLKKYLFFSERASTGQTKLHALANALRTSVRVLDRYQLETEMAANSGGDSSSSNNASGGTSAGTGDELQCVLQVIKALQHAKQATPVASATAAAASAAGAATASTAPATGGSTGVALLSGVLTPLLSITSATGALGGSLLASDDAGGAAGTAAVLDELEIMIDGDAGDAKPNGEVSIAFGSSAKTETLILDIKLKYDTPASASSSAAAMKDEKNVTAAAPVPPRRRVTVDAIQTSIMMSGGSSGLSRDYTHREMDDDVRSLVMLATRGAHPLPVQPAASHAGAAAAADDRDAPAPVAVSNQLTALATSRFLHKLMRIREKERLFDKYTHALSAATAAATAAGVSTGGGGGADPVLNLFGMSDAPHTSGSSTSTSSSSHHSSSAYNTAYVATERLRRLFGDVEAALDAMSAVSPHPLVRCRRVLEGLLAVYWELPPSACNPVLLSVAGGGGGGGGGYSANAIASVSAGSRVWFGLTYVGPFEHFSCGPIAVHNHHPPHHAAAAAGAGSSTPATPSDEPSMSIDGDKQPSFSYLFEVNSSLSCVGDPVSSTPAGVLFPFSIARAIARLAALPASAGATEVEAVLNTTLAGVDSKSVSEPEVVARGASFHAVLLGAGSSSQSPSCHSYSLTVLNQSQRFELPIERPAASTSVAATIPSSSVAVHERAIRIGQFCMNAMPPANAGRVSAFAAIVAIFRAQTMFNHLLSSVTNAHRSTLLATVASADANGALRSFEFVVSAFPPHRIVLTQRTSAATNASSPFALWIDIPSPFPAQPPQQQQRTNNLSSLDCESLPTAKFVRAATTGAGVPTCSDAYATQLLRATFNLPLVLAYVCKTINTSSAAAKTK